MLYLSKSHQKTSALRQNLLQQSDLYVQSNNWLECLPFSIRTAGNFYFQFAFLCLSYFIKMETTFVMEGRMFCTFI